MKTKSIIQYGGNEIIITELEQRVKKIWSSEGNLQKDIRNLRLYLKTEENMVYYVINDEFSGQLQLLG